MIDTCIYIYVLVNLCISVLWLLMREIHVLYAGLFLPMLCSPSHICKRFILVLKFSLCLKWCKLQYFINPHLKISLCHWGKMEWKQNRGNKVPVFSRYQIIGNHTCISAIEVLLFFYFVCVLVFIVHCFV